MSTLLVISSNPNLCLNSVLVASITWNTLEDDEDSPCFEKPNPQPLHNRISIFVTGIHDRLSNDDKSDVGRLLIAAWLLSKAARYSLYWTNTEIDCRSRSLSSALDILGSLKWVTTKVTWKSLVYVELKSSTKNYINDFIYVKRKHTNEASPCFINIPAGTNGGSLFRSTWKQSTCKQHRQVNYCTELQGI